VNTIAEAEAEGLDKKPQKRKIGRFCESAKAGFQSQKRKAAQVCIVSSADARPRLAASIRKCEIFLTNAGLQVRKFGP